LLGETKERTASTTAEYFGGKQLQKCRKWLPAGPEWGNAVVEALTVDLNPWEAHELRKERPRRVKRDSALLDPIFFEPFLERQFDVIPGARHKGAWRPD
jgi:hypothetical protein